METSDLIAIIASITAAANIIATFYLGFRKHKPEVKKIEAESESEIADAVHTSLEGAVLSTTMLKERVDELQKDLSIEKQARRTDAEYFRRRIRDIEKEARDYRLWAARLAKQVIELGKIPSPFVSSLSDSDPLITALMKEQAELEQTKSTRETELKENENK